MTRRHRALENQERVHPELACAEWLDQPIAPYQVDRPLDDDDEIDTGDVTLRVLYLPGHTQGQIALYDPASRTLIAGDALLDHDVGWLNRFREGLCCLYQALDSLERLARLPIDRAYPGHGPPIDDPRTAIDQARRRYESWLDEPEKEAWHACKRHRRYRKGRYRIRLRDPTQEPVGGAAPHHLEVEKETTLEQSHDNAPPAL